MKTKDHLVSATSGPLIPEIPCQELMLKILFLGFSAPPATGMVLLFPLDYRIYGVGQLHLFFHSGSQASRTEGTASCL